MDESGSFFRSPFINKETFGLVIEKADEEQRSIEGMATTPTIDRVGDIVEPSGLTARGSVPLLMHHDKTMPVGTVQFGKPSTQGLPFRAQIARPESPGTLKDRCDEAWDSVKAGVIRGVSIGFIPGETETLPNGGTRFTRAEIHELSLTPVPANPDAVITAFKSITTTEQHIRNQTLAAQVRRALAMDEHQAIISASERKSAVPPGTPVAYGSGTQSGGLFYPGQIPGVVQPSATVPIVTALAQLGAAQLPVNTRILTQGAVLEASEIAEFALYPAAAPNVVATLQGNRKFGLVLALSREMFSLDPTDQVIQYVQTLLTRAHGMATDAAFYAQLSQAAQVVAYRQDAADSDGATIQAAMDGFAGDLRTAAWIAAPATLARLRSPANDCIGPAGGTYYDLPAIASLAVPAGRVLLVDVSRTAVYDGPEEIVRSVAADLVLDTHPASASGTGGTIHLFQQGMVALRVTKYADMQTLVQPTLISLQ